MATWLLIFILALLGALCCAAEAVGIPAPYAGRVGAAGATLVGIAVVLIATPNLR